VHRPPSRIAILGPGRLGRSLHHLLIERGHSPALLGRGAVEAGATQGVDLLLLTVPDAAIGPVARTVPPGPVVLHCSGATDLGPLQGHRARGSLHPLMTFPGPQVALPELHGVPAAIDGDAEGLAHARWLADELGLHAFEVPGDRRLYPAAAALAGNGATLLLGEACRALAAAGVPREQTAGLLAPLVLRSIHNAVPDPAAALTGPVARGDTQVLQAHDRALHEAGLSEVAELHAHLGRIGAAWRRHDLWRGVETSRDTRSTEDDEPE